MSDIPPRIFPLDLPNKTRDLPLEQIIRRFPGSISKSRCFLEWFNGRHFPPAEKPTGQLAFAHFGCDMSFPDLAEACQRHSLAPAGGHGFAMAVVSDEAPLSEFAATGQTVQCSDGFLYCPVYAYYQDNGMRSHLELWRADRTWSPATLFVCYQLRS